MYSGLFYSILVCKVIQYTGTGEYNRVFTIYCWHYICILACSTVYRDIWDYSILGLCVATVSRRCVNTVSWDYVWQPYPGDVCGCSILSSNLRCLLGGDWARLCAVVPRRILGQWPVWQFYMQFSTFFGISNLYSERWRQSEIVKNNFLLFTFILDQCWRNCHQNAAEPGDEWQTLRALGSARGKHALEINLKICIIHLKISTNISFPTYFDHLFYPKLTACVNSQYHSYRR